MNNCCNNDIYPDMDLKRWSVCDTTVLANADNYYTKNEVDDIIDDIVISGGGITSAQCQTLIDGSLEDYYNKSEINEALDGKADSTAVTSVYQAMTAHTTNSGIHVTSTEKAQWNNGISGVTFNNQQATVSNHVANITASIPTITYDPNTKILTITN